MRNVYEILNGVVKQCHLIQLSTDYPLTETCIQNTISYLNNILKVLTELRKRNVHPKKQICQTITNVLNTIEVLFKKHLDIIENLSNIRENLSH